MAKLKKEIQAVAAEIVDAADFIDPQEQIKILRQLRAIREQTAPKIVEALQSQVVTEGISKEIVLAMTIRDFLEKFHTMDNPTLNKLVIPLRKQLSRNGLAYVIELAKLTPKQAFKLEGIGPKRVRYLRRYLQTFGIDFGMNVDEETHTRIFERIKDQHCKKEAGTL